jgi:hypothetical protein
MVGLALAHRPSHFWQLLLLVVVESWQRLRCQTSHSHKLLLVLL